MTDWETIAARAKILIIEDDRMTIQIFTGMLARGGYRNISTTDDPERALEIFRRVEPDLVLLDLRMAPVDGLEVLRQLHEEIPREEFLPILVISGDSTDAAKLNALLLGAKDFITKPVDVVDAMLRIRLRLETRFQFQEMRQTIAQLREAR